MASVDGLLKAMKFQEPSARMAAAFRPNLPVAFFAAQGELAVHTDEHLLHASNILPLS